MEINKYKTWGRDVYTTGSSRLKTLVETGQVDKGLKFNDT